MEKFPKFIIEDGKLILMKVTYHHEIVTNKDKVKGGGWFKYLQQTDTFLFYGDSNDFGKATIEDIRAAVENKQVYSGKLADHNISERHNFGYDTGTEIIEFATKK